MAITRSTNLDPSIQFIISHAPYQSGQILEQHELLNHKNCQPNISISIENYFNNQSPQANLTNLYVSEDTAQKYSVQAARDIGKVIAQWIRYYNFIDTFSEGKFVYGKGEHVKNGRSLACNVQIQNFASDTLPIGQTKKIWKNSSDTITFDGRTFDSIFFQAALTNLNKTGAQILDTEASNVILSLSDYIRAVAESIKRSCDANNICYPNSIHWSNTVEYSFDDMLGDSKSVQYVSDPTKSLTKVDANTAGFTYVSGTSPFPQINTIISYGVGSGARVFVGGNFKLTVGSTNRYHLSFWNGQTWDAVGTTFTAQDTTPSNTYVNSLNIWNHNNRDYLIIGGRFTSSQSNVNCVNIARVDLSSTTYVIQNLPRTLTPPSNIGVGNTDPGIDVRSLTVYNNKLYVGGIFTTAGGTPTITANNIVEISYNNTTNLYEYAAIVVSNQNGARNSSNPATAKINALIVYNNKLIVAGLFTEFGNLTACGNIVQFDASTNTWSKLGSGTNGEIYALEVARTNAEYESGAGELYVGGSFTTVAGLATNRIAKWNGSSWTRITNGPTNGIIRSICNPNRSTQIIVGGTFTNFPSTSVYIARYDGTNWSNLGTGFNNAVNVIKNVNNSFLMIGGVFTYINPTTNLQNLVNRIAKFQSDYLSYFDIMRTSSSTVVYQEFNILNNIWEGKTLANSFADANSPSNVTANFIGNSSTYRDPKNAYQSSNRNFQIAYYPFLQKIKSYATYKVLYEPFLSVFPHLECSNYNHVAPVSSQFITRLPADPNNVFLRIPNATFTNVSALRTKPHLRCNYQSCVCFSPNFTKYTTGTYNSVSGTYSGNFWPIDGIAGNESTAVATDDSSVQLYYDKQGLGTNQEQIYRNWCVARVKSCAAKNNIIPIIPWIESPYEDAANLGSNGRLATPDDILFILKEHYKVGVRKWFVYCPKLQSDNQGTVGSYGKSRSDLLLQVIKDFMSWTNTQTKHSKGIIGAVN